MTATLGPDRLLSALPTYLGGKRKLAPVIFRAIREASDIAPPRARLADPFMGGGSISMLGKVLGYEVHSNDTGARSECIGKALIENSRVQLGESDVDIALTTAPTGWFLPPPEHLKWPDGAIEMIAGICKAAEDFEQPEKRWLVRALAVKSALAISRWGQPRMSVGKKARDKRYDEMTVAQAKTLHYMTEPRKVALTAAKSMYGAVFTNGRRNTMSRMDAVEFLQQTPADVVYLDPPYPGTVTYEGQYVGVDEVLENTALDVHASRFSAPAGWKFLADLVDAVQAPTMVLSLGNEAVSLEQLTEIVAERGWKVEPRAIDHQHLTQLAGDAKKARNLELLLVCKR